jgi:histidinol-phosphatase (PHP family)
MLLPGDYHTHSYLCNHAIGYLEDYINSAMHLGLPEIGLSDHFPMYLLPKQFHKYAMKKKDLNGYIIETSKLKMKFQSKITIKRALEVDYYTAVFPEYKGAIEPILSELDYIIGSIHGITWNGIVIPMDSSFSLPDDFNKNETDSLYFKYYQELKKLVETNFYDILGHFDVIKKLSLPIIEYSIIWESILKVLDSLEKSDMAVEINTSGLWKQSKLFPEPIIIQELIDRNIPLVLGSDAHKPDDVGYAFEETLTFLQKQGLKRIYQISLHQKTPITLN